MCNISNNSIYLSKMRKTFMDKSWFMSIIPNDVTTIVDFGCADNSFNEFLSNSFPEYDYIGIENNEEFLKMMKEKNQVCFSSFKDLMNNYYINPESTLVILNSVIHEIYSYGDINKFWKEISEINPKYIAFRDMYAKNCGIYGSRTQEELEYIALNSNLRQHFFDFTKIWGPINDGYTATHFLLKYFYNENWKREVEENYLPYHYRELHKLIRNAGYNVTFERFYSLPYLKEKWHTDFKCDNNPHLKTFIDRLTTHVKLFLVRGFDKLYS